MGCMWKADRRSGRSEPHPVAEVDIKCPACGDSSGWLGCRSVSDWNALDNIALVCRCGEGEAYLPGLDLPLGADWLGLPTEAMSWYTRRISREQKAAEIDWVRACPQSHIGYSADEYASIFDAWRAAKPKVEPWVPYRQPAAGGGGRMNGIAPPEGSG